MYEKHNAPGTLTVRQQRNSIRRTKHANGDVHYNVPMKNAPRLIFTSTEKFELFMASPEGQRVWADCYGKSNTRAIFPFGEYET
jgi:hypothetical protein